MKENEFDGAPDNDWDETSWSFAWNEFDWEKHLREQDKAVHAYLAHYDKVIEQPDRIDEVAHLMGWDQDGWTNDESEDDASPETPADKSGDKEGAEEGGDEDFEPYTIQRHPVYVSTRALFFWLHRAWEFVAPAIGTRLPTRVALGFTSSLGRAEHYGTLATHSLDMGDFSLAVCQLKRGLAELNHALRHLQSTEETVHPALTQFRQPATVRLFDIREIWLRVMRDCREEIQRRVSEGDDKN